MTPLRTLIAILTLILFASGAAADEQPADTLVILSSDSLQTQGMAMVLSTSLQAREKQIHVLLCDQAGKLAVRDFQPESLAPRNVTPKDLLQNLMADGASVQVCALFLPNSDSQTNDLLDGVSVATPAEITRLMVDPDVAVYTF